MNKYIKALIILNGLVIPIFLGCVIYWSFGNKTSDVSYEEPDGLIVGDKLEKAQKDSLALQGIFYEAPERIYNSTNYYLPVSVMTYEQAKDLRKMAETAGDIGISNYNHINVIFLDKNYNVITQLINEKASISEIYVHYDDNKEIEKTALHMAYLISFGDSNGDGRIDSKDNNDLYISDLQGRNLRQVTKGKEIVDFNFINSNSEILVRYKDRQNIRDEYKRIKFGIYKIKDAKWTDLSNLNSKLAEIEQSMSK